MLLCDYHEKTTHKPNKLQDTWYVSQLNMVAADKHSYVD